MFGFIASAVGLIKKPLSKAAKWVGKQVAPKAKQAAVDEVTRVVNQAGGPVIDASTDRAVARALDSPKVKPWLWIAGGVLFLLVILVVVLLVRRK